VEKPQHHTSRRGSSQREKLGLRVEETGETTVADGRKAQSQITEYVEVRWKNRKSSFWARCPLKRWI
jgi:hypothetical protein